MFLLLLFRLLSSNQLIVTIGTGCRHSLKHGFFCVSASEGSLRFSSEEAVPWGTFSRSHRYQQYSNTAIESPRSTDYTNSMKRKKKTDIINTLLRDLQIHCCTYNSHRIDSQPFRFKFPTFPQFRCDEDNTLIFTCPPIHNSYRFRVKSRIILSSMSFIYLFQSKIVCPSIGLDDMMDVTRIRWDFGVILGCIEYSLKSIQTVLGDFERGNVERNLVPSGVHGSKLNFFNAVILPSQSRVTTLSLTKLTLLGVTLSDGKMKDYGSDLILMIGLTRSNPQ